MVFAAMAVSAVICYIILKKFTRNKVLQIQLVLSALLTMVLAYLIHSLYSLPTAALVFMGLMLLFSVIVGKQMQYLEETVSTQAVRGEVAAGISDEKMDQFTSREPEEMEKELPVPEPQLEMLSADVPEEDSGSLDEEEDLFFRGRQFIIEEEQEKGQQEEEEAAAEEESLPVAAPAEMEEKPSERTAPVETENVLLSEKRARLLEELDEENTTEDNRRRNKNESK